MPYCPYTKHTLDVQITNPFDGVKKGILSVPPNRDTCSRPGRKAAEAFQSICRSVCSGECIFYTLHHGNIRLLASRSEKTHETVGFVGGRNEKNPKKCVIYRYFLKSLSCKHKQLCSTLFRRRIAQINSPFPLSQSNFTEGMQTITDIDRL